MAKKMQVLMYTTSYRIELVSPSWSGFQNNLELLQNLCKWDFITQFVQSHDGTNITSCAGFFFGIFNENTFLKWISSDAVNGWTKE